MNCFLWFLVFGYREREMERERESVWEFCEGGADVSLRWRTKLKNKVPSSKQASKQILAFPCCAVPCLVWSWLAFAWLSLYLDRSTTSARMYQVLGESFLSLAFFKNRQTSPNTSARILFYLNVLNILCINAHCFASYFMYIHTYIHCVKYAHFTMYIYVYTYVNTYIRMCHIFPVAWDIF